VDLGFHGCISDHFFHDTFRGWRTADVSHADEKEFVGGCHVWVRTKMIQWR